MTHSLRTALILGVTGSIGGAIAAALARRGYSIRALTRDPLRAAAKLGDLPVTLIRGDAMDGAAVRAAAEGVDVIVHGVNPPGYVKWREVGIPMLANTIEAAAASGARILFPGNVYVFGPDAGAIVSEVSPQTPTTEKGRTRLDMERMLREAEIRGVRSLIVRAGDFFGPGVEASWFTQAVAKGGVNLTAVQDLGPVGHSWAYLPDLAETFARLLDCEDRLAAHDVFHFAGHWCEPGTTMAEAVQRAVLPRHVPIRRFPWLLMYLGAPFVPFLREAVKMMWLWRRPLRLSNAKLEAVIGPEPHTPLDRAVATAIGRPASHTAIRIPAHA